MLHYLLARGRASIPIFHRALLTACALAATCTFSRVLRAQGTAAPNAPAAAAASTADNLASTPQSSVYGLIIGSNRGGAGQEPLRYAGQDARRMQQTLAEVARQGKTELALLEDPTGAQAVAAIEELAAKVTAAKARGEQTFVFFYYSGHARANSLNLGQEELPLSVLRQRLALLPATFTFVALDACQSGAFARAKGAQRAEDFSFNSVQSLTAKGLAVMASSSAEELSQESEELRGSFFTHHLAAALRGAADADGDGRVTLDEAYRYASRRTLASTSKTRLGGQHVTFETELSGQGEATLSYPRIARAQLELAAPLAARVLVTLRGNGSIAAEVYKAPGRVVRVALQAGLYDAVVREPSGTVQCSIQVVDGQPTALDLATCTPVKADAVARKGEFDESGPIAENVDAPTLQPGSSAGVPRSIREFALGFRVGIGARSASPYTQRLERFGYRNNDTLETAPRLGVSGLYGSQTLQFGAQFEWIGGKVFGRDYGTGNETTAYTSVIASAVARAQHQPGEFPIGIFAQATLGFGLARIKFASNATPIRSSSDTQTGFSVGGSGGLYAQDKRVRFSLALGVDYNPVGKNLLGDKLNTGGFFSALTLDILLGSKDSK